MQHLLSTFIVASTLAVTLTSLVLGDEPDAELKKKLAPITTKLESKKADDQIAGLKAAAVLKEEALSLMPKISKVMLSTNPKVAAQAAITIEQIDQNLYKVLMNVGTRAQNREIGLDILSRLDEERMELIQPVVVWLLPQFPAVISTRTGDAPTSHAASMIRILSKSPKMRTEFRDYCLKAASLKANRQEILCAAIQGFESLTESADKDEKKSFAASLAKLLTSDSIEVRYAAVKTLSKLPDQAAMYLKEVEQAAAFDQSDAVRKMAGDLLKKIDK